MSEHGLERREQLRSSLERRFLPRTGYGWGVLVATLSLSGISMLSGRLLIGVAWMLYPVVTVLALWSNWSRDVSWRDKP